MMDEDMNEELLSETLTILAKQLLTNPAFCGSIEGRRLRELLWEIARASTKQGADRGHD